MGVVNYYPWRIHVLADWIDLELSRWRTIDELAKNLRVPRYVLQNWQKFLSPCITLEQIQAIANYRVWSFERTVRWLDICSAHLEDLQAFSEASTKVQQLSATQS